MSAKPVSTKLPDPADFVATREMTAVLHEIGAFEPEDRKSQRDQAFAGLTSVVEAWAARVSAIKGVEGDVKNQVRVMTFGSSRLGVATPDADIDLVVIVAKHIERKDFFSALVSELISNPLVSDLHPVKEARVPVVKLKWDGIDMDMLLARLALREIPSSLDLTSDALLRNMDEQSVLSLNGCRVAEAILRLVPDPHNFRVALRFVKAWAKRRLIYSNVLGYFAGVSLALLVARVCQLYPNALPSVLVARFFRVYEQWQWPRAVVLCHTQEKSKGLSFHVWNPKTNYKDAHHVLPVITPVFPAMNSMSYASDSTLRAIKAEIRRGDALAAGSGSGMPQARWREMLEPSSVFGDYKHFVCLDVASATVGDHIVWFSLVESRLRAFILALQKASGVSHVRPCPTHHTIEGSAAYPVASSLYLALVFDSAALKAQGTREVDLTAERESFSALVKRDAVFNEKTMFMLIRHVRRDELPLEVRSRDSSGSGLGKSRNASNRKKRSREDAA